ncbi:AraC family transcriptional regulator [Pseudoalteromonas sp. SIMBA_153]
MNANELIEKHATNQFITKEIDMSSSYVDDYHSHSWHQIIFPYSGLLQSSIENKRIVVPHNALLYIPASTIHKSIAVTDTKFLAVYLNPNNTIEYSNELKSCLLTPFVKELILLLFNNTEIEQPAEELTNLLTVFRDQIAMANSYEIPLLIPKDRRLMSIFSQLHKQPSLKLTAQDWSVKVGASQRTLSRICAKEFNQSFSLWRQNIKLVLSLHLLASNKSIQEIALDLGYASDSAYIHAFKNLFAETPNKYRKNSL